MSPGEVVLIRAVDLDTTGKLWILKPHKHKTQLHGHKREVYFGPRARSIVEQFLKLDPAAYIFSPTDAEAERREKLRLRRKTPMNEGNRPGTNRRRKPERTAGARYTALSYYRAVQRGCDRADSWAKVA